VALVRADPASSAQEAVVQLDQILNDRYHDEHLAADYHQRYIDARVALRDKAHSHD
jgi:hypothetical protein